MPETLLAVFVVTSILLIITPGQDMILVMSRSITQGWKAGVVTAAGVSVGLLGHTVIATVGLGAALKASELLFTAMKIVGAMYLVYLGIKMIRHSGSELDISTQSNVSLRRMFLQGAFSNISNPKIVIFYLAFLPQFIPATSPHPTLMMFTLGVVFALLTFLVKGPVGCVAGLLSNWLRSRPAVIGWIHRSSGMVLIALGLRLALEKRT